jgi:hypothetical protein
MVDPECVAGNTMHGTPKTPGECACAGPSTRCNRERSLSICDTAFVGLILFTLVHATEAMAGDQAQGSGLAPGSGAENSDAAAARHPIAPSSWMSPIPDPFRAAGLPAAASEASTEFRPRKHASIQGKEGSVPLDDGSIMRSSSVWERLSQSRSRDGVQLVTLWHTGGNSLSLQANNKGDPTLQFTSRLMNRSGPHGLLDDFFSTTLSGAAGRGLHILPRTAGIDATPKPARPADAPIGVPGAER